MAKTKRQLEVKKWYEIREKYFKDTKRLAKKKFKKPIDFLEKTLKAKKEVRAYIDNPGKVVIVLTTEYSNHEFTYSRSKKDVAAYFKQLDYIRDKIDEFDNQSLRKKLEDNEREINKLKKELNK